MEKIHWGKEWQVSKLCFGTLCLGPLQKGLSPEKGGEIILKAFEMGLNFVDTAQMYKTYPHLRRALDQWDGKVYISTKSAASTYQEMDEAVREAREELGRNYIDLFLLHGIRAGSEVFEEREGAIKCLQEYKDRGIIGKMGIATHNVSVVEKSCTEANMEVIFPLINITGKGILGGSREEMEKAISLAHRAGKKLMAMKVYGGGTLLNQRKEAIDYALSLPGMDVLVIGMVTNEEILANISILSGKPNEELLELSAKEPKELIIIGSCIGCGKCLDHCPNGALFLKGDRCEVRKDKCILCGYCAHSCPEFSLRFV